MKLRNRFLLVGFGVVAFLIATPVLVLFTRGYEIDWSHYSFVQTGAFVIKTLPSKADIYLNNKKISATTPETVRFLLPGDYDVRLQKDGYQSWTKRLTINPQFATWINLNRDFVALFYTTPQSLSTTSLNFSTLSQDNSQIAFGQNNQLKIYNLNSQTTDNLGDISNQRVPYTFASDLSWTNGDKVMNFFNTHASNVPFNITDIHQVQANGDYMVALAADQLYTLDTDAPVLVDKQVSGFSIDGENLWYIQGNLLKQYNLRTAETSTVFSNLPTAAKVQIIRGDGNTFLLLDNSLYTLNDTLEKIYDNVNYANYDLGSHTLLFADANEIFTYDPASKNTTLILRSINPITNPLLNNYTGYVFFMDQNTIKTIELDGRDHRNIYTILGAVTSDSKFTLSTDGSVLAVFDNSTLTTYKIR